MKATKMLAGFVAAVVLAAACDSATTTPRAAEKATPAGGPSLTYGATASVTVRCPSNLENSQSGQCVAHGYDSQGRFTTSSGATWSTSTSSLISVSSGLATAAASGIGTATVSATIGGITGSTSITIRSSADLSVSIQGESSVRPNVDCAFWANAAGGTGSYSYSWSATSPATGSANGGEWVGRSSSSYTLSVTVSDGVSSVSANKSVTVSSGAFVCPL